MIDYNDYSTQEILKTYPTTPAPRVNGKFHIQWAKRGKERINWTFDQFNVTVGKIGNKWTIIGSVSGKSLQIEYDKKSAILKILLEVDGKNRLWEHDEKFKSKIESDDKTLIIRWLGHIETNEKDHYNIMNDSVIIATYNCNS